MAGVGYLVVNNDSNDDNDSSLHLLSASSLTGIVLSVSALSVCEVGVFESVTPW